MKIVIINGSPKINGTTKQILSKINETLLNIDSKIEICYVNLSKISMKFCCGCICCYRTGEREIIKGFG